MLVLLWLAHAWGVVVTIVWLMRRAAKGYPDPGYLGGMYCEACDESDHGHEPGRAARMSLFGHVVPGGNVGQLVIAAVNLTFAYCWPVAVPHELWRNRRIANPKTDDVQWNEDML